MKKNTLVVLLLLAIVGSFSSSAYAAETTGIPVKVFADPSDVVVELDTAGECGSRFFHIQRQNTNFKELTALALTAFSGGKRLAFFVVSCSTERNIVAGGYVSR